MTYLSVLHLATAGLNGPLLGSDEEEIVLICIAVLNVHTNQVVTSQDFWVKPRSADINENVLSESAKEELGLSEELIRTKGASLENVLIQVDSFLSKMAEPVVLVADGQLPLRQCLLPETVTKNINEIPNVFCLFYDLRKEFRQKYSNEVNSVQDMVQYLNLEPEESAGQQNATRRESLDMVRILQRLINEGHKFESPETINLRLEPGICSKDEEVDSNTVVRARGLPWQSSDQDIARFFRGLNVARGGVALCLSAQGRRNGEALVRFVSAEHRDMALKRHKHHIGPRYIEVYKATGDDFIDVAGGSNNEAQNFLSRNGQVIVRMRGLPYDCTAKQVIEFFESGGEDVSSKVLDGDAGVLFVKKHDGRATGDAFVMFATEEEGSKALAKHRDIIGSRYIELFRSTTAEVQQVLNRSMDPRTYETPAPLIPQLPLHQAHQLPLLPQQMITSGTRKDCIRLRGLPYEAQVEHILEFLGEHAKSIVYQGVHMVYNAQGQPSGEAFIQMDSEQSSFQAAHQRHHHYMVFGKKQRYIEVFQCSGEDMHLVLTGGLALPSTPATPKALLSPGMLPWDPSNNPSPQHQSSSSSSSSSIAAAAAAQAQILQQAQAAQAALQEQAQAAQQLQQALAAHAVLKQQQEGLWLMGLAPPPTSNPSSVLNRPPPSLTNSSAPTRPPIGRPGLLPTNPTGLGLLGQGGLLSRPPFSTPFPLMPADYLALLGGANPALFGTPNSVPTPNPLLFLGGQHQHQMVTNRPGVPPPNLAALQAAKAAGSLLPGVPAHLTGLAGAAGGFKRSWEAAFQQQQDATAAALAAAAAAKRQWPGSSGASGSSSNSSYPSFPAL